MTKSEYQQLVEFLAPRFDDLGNRLDSVENRLTRVELKVEENSHQIQAVAEGLTAFREQTSREFTALRQEMADGFELHGAVVRDLCARMDR